MNIVKHAGVNQALVSLDVNVGCFRSAIPDEGLIHRESQDRPLVTLSACRMYETALPRVGGTFVIDSRVGKGTSIALTLPLEKLTERLFSEREALSSKSAFEPGLPNRQISNRFLCNSLLQLPALDNQLCAYADYATFFCGLSSPCPGVDCRTR
jgi:hypothetical protein